MPRPPASGCPPGDPTHSDLSHSGRGLLQDLPVSGSAEKGVRGSRRTSPASGAGPSRLGASGSDSGPGWVAGPPSDLRALEHPCRVDRPPRERAWVGRGPGWLPPRLLSSRSPLLVEKEGKEPLWGEHPNHPLQSVRLTRYPEGLGVPLSPLEGQNQAEPPFPGLSEGRRGLRWGAPYAPVAGRVRRLPLGMGVLGSCPPWKSTARSVTCVQPQCHGHSKPNQHLPQWIHRWWAPLSPLWGVLEAGPLRGDLSAGGRGAAGASSTRPLAHCVLGRALWPAGASVSPSVKQYRSCQAPPGAALHSPGLGVARSWGLQVGGGQGAVSVGANRVLPAPGSLGHGRWGGAGPWLPRRCGVKRF